MICDQPDALAGYEADVLVRKETVGANEDLGRSGDREKREARSEKGEETEPWT